MDRARLESLAYTVDIDPDRAAPIAAEPRAAHWGPAGVLAGYRSDAHVSTGWRVVVIALFVAAVSGVGYSVVIFTHGDLPATRQNVIIISTLEEQTKRGGANATNTIPSFLSLPGATGVLEPSMGPGDLLKPLNEADLKHGFCSPSVARQVRYQYPGYYESWPDDKLAHVVLEKYPEYQDRLCVLPHQIDAAPDDIVKYEIRSRSTMEFAGLWLRTLLITAVFAIALMNLYYRVLVSRLASA